MEIAMCRLLFQEAKGSQFFQLFHGMWFPVFSSILVAHSQTSSYFPVSFATGHNPKTEFINTKSNRIVSLPIDSIIFFWYSLEMERGRSPWSVGSKTVYIKVPARRQSFRVRYLYQLNNLET